MRLESFKISDFRSINDSGSIDVAQITAVLGRNESDKCVSTITECSLF